MIFKSDSMRSVRTVGIIISAALIVCLASGCGRGIEVGPIDYPLPTMKFTLNLGDAIDDVNAGEKAVESLDVEISQSGLPSQDEVQSLVSEVSPSLARFATISRIELGSAYVNGPPDSFRAIRGISVYYKPDDNPANEKLIASASSSDGFGAEIELTPAGSFDFLEVLPESGSNNSVKILVKADVETDDLPTEDEPITAMLDITLEIYARVSLGH